MLTLLFGVPSEHEVRYAVASGDYSRLRMLKRWCCAPALRRGALHEFLTRFDPPLPYSACMNGNFIKPITPCDRVHLDSRRSFPLLDAARCEDGDAFDLLLDLTDPARIDYARCIRLLMCFAEKGDAKWFVALSEATFPLSALRERDRTDLITCVMESSLDRLNHQSSEDRKGDGLSLLRLLWCSGPHSVGPNFLYNLPEKDVRLLYGQTV
ncbi:hypothetical protein JKP88DRAFT_248306 [Tribonema minus]|uniref:Uncharacterized protein n=1 Tax=Tribonema minus TaxID=303371 RepID=A0A836CAS8_9STRA|nr:hypothetical protein JKP88DRAFT_248306 [Tribonema minus]